MPSAGLSEILAELRHISLRVRLQDDSQVRAALILPSSRALTPAPDSLFDLF